MYVPEIEQIDVLTDLDEDITEDKDGGRTTPFLQEMDWISTVIDKEISDISTITSKDGDKGEEGIQSVSYLPRFYQQLCEKEHLLPCHPPL